MGKLTVQDIAKSLAGKSGLAQRDASQFASEVFAVILQGLEKDGQVKVKGLGTFKIISVEARESVSVRTGERVVIEGHEKVTFTPDSVMKELVNKPFSQFETVVLNEGVEFDDLKDDVAEEESERADAEIEEAVTHPQLVTLAEEISDVENKTESVAEPILEEEPVSVETIVSEDQTVEEQPVAPVLEFAEPETSVEEEIVDEGTDTRPWWKWLVVAVVVLALMGMSFYGGYYYAMKQMGSQQTALPEEKVPEPVGVGVAHVDSQVVLKDSISEIHAQADTVPETKQEVSPEPKPEPKVEAKPDLDPYAAKDERVRLGAYRIVGTAKEVKIEPGQTFYSICRAHLGPDMECYVEVYNDLPRNPKLKTGQILKIPKLESKKRRRH